MEHARILVFANGGDEKIFMGSSDWMKRNLDRRVEVMTPIYDSDVKKILRKVVDLQLADNVKARKWDKELKNEYATSDGERVRSQYEIYNFFKQQLINSEKLEEA